MIGAIVAGGLSAMTPPVTNSWESIETFTVGSGGTSSITFGSGGTIPQTYKHLQIRGICVPTTSTASVTLRLNGDNTTTNYYYHRLQGLGSGTPNAAAGNIYRIMDSAGTGSYFNTFVIDFLDYSNTNKNKTTRALSGYDANGSGEIRLESNLWNNTAAINSISFYLDSGNPFAQYSSFALYGIKG